MAKETITSPLLFYGLLKQNNFTEYTKLDIITDMESVTENVKQPIIIVRKYKAKTGPKTALNDKMFDDIRICVEQGMNLPQIAKKVNVPYNTLVTWKTENYLGLNEKISEYKRNRILDKAVEQIELLTTSERENISLEASKFVLETLGKKYYSKKESNINIINVPTPILGNMLDSSQVVKTDVIDVSNT